MRRTCKKMRPTTIWMIVPFEEINMDTGSVVSVLLVCATIVVVIGMILNHKDRAKSSDLTLKMAERGLVRTLVGQGDDVRWEWIPYEGPGHSDQESGT